MGLELELLGLVRLLGGCDSGVGPGGVAGAPGRGKCRREGLLAWETRAFQEQ